MWQCHSPVGETKHPLKKNCEIANIYFNCYFITLFGSLVSNNDDDNPMVLPSVMIIISMIVNHCYIFVFPDLCLDKQTKLSAQLFILAQHVSPIRPWSRAAFYWTEFTFTSHEVKVNFVPKLDINQKSESKDPHWQSISSELFEKTQPLRGLMFHL